MKHQQATTQEATRGPIVAVLASSFPPRYIDEHLMPYFRRLGVQIVDSDTPEAIVRSKLTENVTHVIAMVDAIGPQARATLSAFAKRNEVGVAYLTGKRSLWAKNLGLPEPMTLVEPLPESVEVRPKVVGGGAPEPAPPAQDTDTDYAMVGLYEQELAKLEATVAEKTTEHIALRAELENASLKADGRVATERRKAEHIERQLTESRDQAIAELSRVKAELDRKRELVGQRDATLVKLEREQADLERRLRTVVSDRETAIRERNEAMGRAKTSGDQERQLRAAQNARDDALRRIGELNTEREKARTAKAPAPAVTAPDPKLAELRKVAAFVRTGLAEKLLTTDEALAKLLERI